MTPPRDTTANVVSIPPGAAFLDCLAQRLCDGTLLGGPPVRRADPMALGEATVLLPNRRAARRLSELLVARSGGAVILPRIAAIGDVDEDLALVAAQASDDAAEDFAEDGSDSLPPAVSALERHLALTRLVYAFGQQKARALNYPGRSDGLLIPVGAADASALARDLARLLDSLQTEGVAPQRLAGLVPEDHAAYWEIAFQFLQIVVEAWPAHLAGMELSDPIARRTAMILAEVERLKASPPQHPFIIAGSTGSVPATAALMGVVARLPRGWIVLPGLDTGIDDEAWQAIRAEDGSGQTHPQFGLARLLAALEIERADVRILAPAETTNASTPPARARLVTEIFRPAQTTERWHETRTGASAAEALGGLSLVVAQSPREEAAAIALALREAIETGRPDAALVTPDRGLARRVSGELARWGLAVDDSAGRPLSACRAGIFVRHVLEAAADNLAPVSLAALLRHPLLRGPEGLEAHAAIDALEAIVLRGPRPQPGLAGLKQALDARLGASRLRNAVAERLRGNAGDSAAALIEHLESALSPLLDLAGGREPPLFLDVTARLRDAAMMLSGGQDAEGEPFLHAGDDGAMLAAFLDGLRDSFDTGMRLPLDACPAFVASLMDAVPVRAARRDQRIAILGPLEARLQQFGRVVLGGLNEGAWPADARTDPWLSRTMCRQVGLDLPERRIGLAAHDVAQHLAAADVVMTRSLRADNAPTVASRWLQRLEAVADKDAFAAMAQRGARYLGWARALDNAGDFAPLQEPRPCPKLADRPRRLSVTQAERLARDPYAIYASKVLSLDPLAPLEENADAALRGTLVHEALARFVRTGEVTSGADAAARLEQHFEAVMQEQGIAGHTRALWRPRLKRIAQWFAEFESDLRRDGRHTAATEVEGRMSLAAPGGDFVLTARADRIDILGNGQLAVMDYKTGEPPTLNQVKAGLALQLTLEAAIAADGGFDTVVAATPGELMYLRLSGGTPAGERRMIAPSKDGDSADELARAGLDRFRNIIAKLDDPAMPYRPRIAAKMLRDDESFDHLSRFREWSTADGGSEEL
ncbi:MAG: double-strand break repair protein AddB [Rhodobiaceae bacterium]|nr:double-strand break repair protein AddB [Rhodobiaceae bacterium]